MPLYEKLEEQAEFLGMPTVPPMTKIDEYVKDGDTLRWGGYTARVIHTPGHTPGSITLFSDVARRGERADAGTVVTRAGGAPVETRAAEAPLLIAGDTLFQGGIGRTDLWGGSMRDILRSIHEKLLVLPEATRVIPGHGGETTIGEEREGNTFLR
jgi:hydroxyacylglutathione hydrolase